MENKKSNLKQEGNGVFFKMIVKYYAKEWKLSLVLLGLMGFIVCCNVLVPLITQQITFSIQSKVDGYVPPSTWWGLTWQEDVIIGVVAIVANSIASYMFNYVGFLMGRKIEISLRNRSLEALVRQDISYYSDKKIGEILTKVISDTQIVGDQAVMIPMLVGISVFQILASLIMMLILSATLAAVVIVIFLMIILAMYVSFKITTSRYNKVRTVITDINGNVTDRIATVRLIKSTGTENYETERFKQVHEEYYAKSRKVGQMQALMLATLFGGVSLLQFSTLIATAIIYGTADTTVAAEFFKNTFAAFLSAQGMMIGPLFNAMNASFGLAQAAVAAKRINDTLIATSIMDPHYFDGEEVESIDGNIEFKGVRFAYPEKPTKTILPKFDFTFEKGKSYAFVGETGSGKSTISKLLLRFYDPTEGEIIVNGKTNLKDVHLSSYLNHVGYVEQDPQILFGDVYENVRYGRFDATNEEVIEACKMAELDQLIQTWPDGYDTILGERGFMLSGGQKQRLIIARMFLKDPQLLILDEATSALDNIVEKEIQAKLETLMVGRTTVSIAHRLSTIKNADHIIVLGADGAGIVQTGTFEELKKMPGHFQKLYNAGLMD
ncbi:ABC transporter ATP-binding protein [[Acholeplasma] multilocale]|uniref:ABC transporter ATP-binding protein n=1 Tax=[Acholeplasma] multilocale TaxID=264638 RepID=UPI0004787A43|nr:ABC transporter ATP-binding protein [[Acholeplasma] multilocale]